MATASIQDECSELNKSDLTHSPSLKSSDYFKAALARFWPCLSEHSLKKVAVISADSHSNKGHLSEGNRHLIFATVFEEAALKFKESVHGVVRAEQKVTVANEKLRIAEEAHSLLHDRLQQHCEDFGEHRSELERSASPIKSRLEAAEQEAQCALRQLKDCEDVAAACLSSLRRAEADLEGLLLGSRHKSSDLERTSQNANTDSFAFNPARFEHSAVPSGASSISFASTQADTAMVQSIAIEADQCAEVDILRSKLARMGISVATNASEALLRRIHAAAGAGEGGFLGEAGPSPRRPARSSPTEQSTDIAAAGAAATCSSAAVAAAAESIPILRVATRRAAAKLGAAPPRMDSPRRRVGRGLAMPWDGVEMLERRTAGGSPAGDVAAESGDGGMCGAGTDGDGGDGGEAGREGGAGGEVADDRVTRAATTALWATWYTKEWQVSERD